LDLDFIACVDGRAATVMTCVFLEILAEICPAATDADHDSLAVLADETYEELDGCFAGGAGEVVEFDLWVAALWAGTRRSFAECWGEGE